ncbi:hypothetical protein HD598_002302 [Neomicrococcus aestuarii]|uniref:Uncharacterized protein n=1 Tax=Neomicrococcus aestuarii TaxID=556325 RepID=A0A7W8TVE1_9MICC|nr:hypothetical protein [Neomicrococcus aestuarii]MBB5513615.1 hypothetical protein [Neomicrococcus aestuarii]
MADQAPLKINYGRLAVAAVGLLAFVTMLVAGILALAGKGTGGLSFSMLLIVFASFVGLRALALRARQRRAMERVQQAFADAMNPHFDNSIDEDDRPRLAIASDYKGPSRPFDAQAVEPAEGTATNSSSRGTAHAVTGAQLAAEEEAAEASSSSQKSTQDSTLTSKLAREEWEPVNVPKPLYTEAPVIKRDVAEPLPKPEEKKATPGAPSIRQSEDLARVVHRAGTDALIQGYAESLETGRIDIDKVLRRRRA